MNEDKDGEEIEQIELEINGILFEEHPYIDKDFGKQLHIPLSWIVYLVKDWTNCTCSIVLDEDKQQMMSAGLKIGEVSVLQPGESETWSNPMLCQRILKTYGDDPFKDVVVERVNQTTEVSNEFFSTIF